MPEQSKFENVDLFASLENDYEAEHRLLPERLRH